MIKKPKIVKAAIIVILVLGIIYGCFIMFASYDLKRINKSTSVTETLKYTNRLIKSSVSLAYNAFSYKMSSLTKTKKVDFEGEYENYPLIGEIFATLNIDNESIKIVNEMSTYYSDIYIHHYPTSSYPGEGKSIWLLCDGNLFYDQFTSSTIEIESSIGKFSYSLIEEYETDRESFIFDFNENEEIICITFVYRNKIIVNKYQKN